MLPILPSSAWLEFRGAPTKKGQNLTTHQALISDGKGGEHKCFVKASPDNYPMAFSEGIAWLIADALDLPRPKFAALLELPVQRLKHHVKLDQYWMHKDLTLAFCCSTVDGKHINSMWKWLERLRQAKAFSNDDLARIAAFDLWTDNRDRHTGNFLKTRTGIYTPIDNELVLYSLLWEPRGLGYRHNSLIAEGRTLLTSAGYLKFQDRVVEAAKKHETAYQASSLTLQTYVDTLNADPDPMQKAAFTANLLGFLQHRAQGGWVEQQLGMIP